MKELELYEFLPMIREDLGKDDITVLELNQWCEKYYKTHHHIYLKHTRVDINHAHDYDYIYWEIRDEESDMLRKQESLECPICGDKHYKYPNTERFEVIKEMIEVVKLLRENKWNLK